MLRILTGYYATVTANRQFTIYLACQLVDKIIHAPFNPFMPIFVAEQLGRPQAFAALMRGAETLAQTTAAFCFGLLSTNARAKAALVVASLNTPLAAALFLIRSPRNYSTLENGYCLALCASLCLCVPLFLWCESLRVCV